jgi:hypothetical protein
MSNFLNLLPLALDAGSPQEAERIVVRKPRIEPAPLPKAWLEPSKPPSRTSAALIFRGVLLATILGFFAWDFFTPATTHVTPTTTTTQDSACPAPQQQTP